MMPCPLRAALHDRIPELADDLIEIVAIARDPGHRAKVAVRARIPGVNPVGACIGWGGLRISDVEKRLNGERVSIVAYDPDPATFVTSALGLPSATAHITDPDHHEIAVRVDAGDYPRALGKYGHNLRLAGRLTHWRIHLQASDDPSPAAATSPLVATPYTHFPSPGGRP
jgi:transcription termination/antitermination protein NusA